VRLSETLFESFLPLLKRNNMYWKIVALYPELLLDLTNGQTLCYDCHQLKTRNDFKILKLSREVVSVDYERI